MEEIARNTDNNNPLVSIVVITYNSAKYVLETLESAKAQTYQNIELIVSDDCSTDNTVEICRNWIDENKDRFVRTELITVEKNTGIAPNCNRGLYKAEGEWVKFIAGDDVLLEECIFECVKYTLQNIECEVLFTRVYYLKNNILQEDSIPQIFSVDTEKQYLKTLTGSSIKAPSSFISIKALYVVDGFDENYPFIEDVPLWIKLSRQKKHFYYLDKFLIKYRIHADNISMNNKTKNYVNLMFFESNQNLLEKIIIPELFKMRKLKNILECYKYLIVKRLIIILGNKNNTVSKVIDNLFNYSSYKKLYKKLNM